jgi:acyl-coenzyme A synthetase/AMP-(fatty) acid ligase
MLDFFYNDIFDEEIILKDKKNTILKKELKNYVYNNLEIVKNKKENVILVTHKILDFTINFFASILTNKNIYLVDDIRKIKNVADFDILTNANYDINEQTTTFPKTNEDKILIHLMTSGSSGEVKDIIKSLTNLIEEARDINKTFNFGTEQLVISSTTTCSHLFGLTFGFMFPICNHHIIDTNTVEYPDKFDTKNGVLVSTPSFLDTVKKNNIILNETKYIISAGSKLNETTFEYLEKYANVIEIYGSTETGVIAHKQNARDKFHRPFKKVKIKLLEDSMLIDSPYAYESKIEIKDRVEIEDGKLYLKNRTDRLLKIQEKRISAESLEKELNTNLFVLDNYCFKYKNKIACLCALSEEGKKEILKIGTIEFTKKLKSFLKNKLEIIPQTWKFIDEIPKTKAGKIDKDFINHFFQINISFPVILDRFIEENKITYKLYFYKNCNFYNGHFPNFPITPGVVQLYLASFLGEYHFKKELVAGQIRKIKFSNIINAGDVVNLCLILNNSNVSYEYLTEGKTFSSGTFSCENVFKGV